jgi:hypothetical protein
MMSFNKAITILMAGALFGTPVFAQNQAADKERSTEQTAGDVATQPVEDLGLDKKEIPEVLERIGEDPYSLSGIRNCASIRAGVEELDEVLGEDFDVRGDKSRETKRKETAGKIGSTIVNSIIPFRGIIREVTGAASQERRYNEAIYAGVVRRSFLKGIGKQRGCRYPAAPAIAE